MPGDVSVTGRDDLILSRHFVPSITAVFQDRQRFGVQSMLRLLDAVRGEEPPAMATELQHVVWRESTGTLRNLTGES